MPKEDSSYVQHLDGRVSKLETNVASIATEVSSIKESQALIVGKLDSLASNQAQHGKLSWPFAMFLIALVTLLVGGMNLVLSPIHDIQNRSVKIEERLIQEVVENQKQLSVNEVKIQHLVEELHEHTSLNNHPHQQTYRLEQLEKEVKRINEFGSDTWKLRENR